MKITQEQFDELNFLQLHDTKAFNEKLSELLEVETASYTVYQYFYGDNFVGDSGSPIREILHNMGVEIER